jgi:ubiquinone/menaquinone biosynthesis C-methylase UbiE
MGVTVTFARLFSRICQDLSSTLAWVRDAIFPFYPASANVVGIDLSPATLTRADRRARKAGRAVDLRLMDVTDLKLPDRSFDAAVASFLFCVLPEEQQEPAVREIARVLKPGGTLRLLEYVRPTGAVRAFVARLWEP